MEKKKLLRAVMAGSLVLNTFGELASVVQAAETLSEGNLSESITESIIDGITKTEEILSEDNNLVVEDVENEEQVTDNFLGDNKEEKLEGAWEEALDVDIDDDSEEQEEEPAIINEFDGEEGIASHAAAGSGLVQLWQVVPDGQQSKEGKSTSEIMNALKCKPNHNLYPLNSTEHQTYVNSCYVDDALYLGEDANYYYIYLSGYEGKVPKKESQYFELDLNNDGTKVKYEIQTVAYYIPESGARSADLGIDAMNDVPELKYTDDYLDKYIDHARSIEAYSTKTVQSPSYYANENGTLVHYVTNNVTVSNNYSKFTVGKAPSWMKGNTKYYSYDGVYFYANWQNIKVNGSGAINQNQPFYNYYQYLPFRSKSNYTANVFDTFTNNNGGTGGKLVDAGKYFYAVQDKYGINGALQYAMGIHESGWGKSSLSMNKNNLFGMNATDNNPYGNGTSFPSVEAGINYHADRYISWGYTDPIDDARFFGSHVGNKGSGMNVKYASDPFWGEKISGWYYRFDQSSGLKDYDHYTIGIKTSNAAVDVKSSASSSSTTYYQTMNKKSNLRFSLYPVLITGESNGYYRIQTDTPIINGKPAFSGQYDFSKSVGYIQKSAISTVNHTNYVSPGSYNYTGRLDSISWKGEKLTISGYGELKGLEMKTADSVKHEIILEIDDKKYTYNMKPVYSSWLAKDPHNLGGNYAYGWYEGTLDLSNLPDGEYKIYHQMTVNGYKQKEELVYYNNIPSHLTKLKDYSFNKYNDSSLKLVKRSSTNCEYIGRLDSVTWKGEKLTIEGYGELGGLEMKTSDSVKHEIILDSGNQQYKFTMTPVYNSWLAADPHNLGGNYAYGWYKGTVDLSSLPDGEYRVYHQMTVNGHIQKEELLYYNTIETRIINSKEYNFNTNNSNLSLIKKMASTREYVGRLDSVSWNGQKLTFSGYGELKGLEMKTADSVKHEIILECGDKKYTYSMKSVYNSWLAKDPHNLGGNYAYGWYEGTLDLSNLPDGEYRIYHQITVNGYTQKEELVYYNNIPSHLTKLKDYSFNKYNDSSLKLVKQSATNCEYIGRLDSVTWKGEKLTIEGYGELSGLEMKTADSVKHEIILDSGNQQYKFTMTPVKNSWLAADPHNLGGNYAYGWYKGTLDLSSLPDGEYRIYHQMTVNGHIQKEELLSYNNLDKRITNLKEYIFTNYNASSLKLTKKTTMKREYIGRLDSLNWSGEKLTIEGYGELSGLEMKTADSVKHEIILDSGNQQYKFTMTPVKNSWLAADPHNLGGNYAYGWYKGTLDLSSLPNGEYKIYHQMTVNGHTQKEEMKIYLNLSNKTVGNKVYSFKLYNNSSLQLTKNNK